MFPNSDSAEIITQDWNTCLETARKIAAWSNGRIGNYDYFRETG